MNDHIHITLNKVIKITLTTISKIPDGLRRQQKTFVGKLLNEYRLRI